MKTFLVLGLFCLQVHYFNEIMGVWEPLLEPLEDETKDSFRPWSLELKVLAHHSTSTVAQCTNTEKSL